MGRVVAVTGATGFIGRHLTSRLVAEGWTVRALCRDPSRAPPGTQVVAGSLEDGGSLRRVVEGSDVVVHLAGLVKARRASEFERANARGVTHMVEALRAATAPRRLVLVSSLAARDPEVSAYAASKRRGEDVALRACDGIDLSVVRPPAVYGPGDRASLPIFQQLRRGFLVAPATSGIRVSLLFVDDLVDLLARLLATTGGCGQIMEPDDGREGGYGWPDLAAIAERGLGRRIRMIPVPRVVARCVAAVDQAVANGRGALPLVGVDKVREMYHPNWVSRAGEHAPLSSWTARTPFEAGVTRTMSWYERQGWL